MFDKKIGIISLGLIGGSLLKNLSTKFKNIYAVTRNEKTISEAQIYTKKISVNYEILKDCDIVFVCSPMNKTIEILDKLETILKPNTIVADVSSLKSFVCNKKRPYKFIGTHPMAGTEHNGFEYSFANLFTEAKWVVVPNPEVNDEDHNLLKNIINETGAKIISMDAQEHDQAVAIISHMPLLLAQALTKLSMNNELSTKLAASGFRDMTRLAMSNTTMANDMMKMNFENIRQSLSCLTNEAINLLENPNYIEQIEQIKDFRSNMYNAEGKNIHN